MEMFVSGCGSSSGTSVLMRIKVTSSGVSAGIDVTIAFIEAVYGNATATSIANGMEYVRHLNSTEDPFAALYGLTDANNSTNQN